MGAVKVGQIPIKVSEVEARKTQTGLPGATPALGLEYPPSSEAVSEVKP